MYEYMYKYKYGVHAALAHSCDSLNLNLYPVASSFYSSQTKSSLNFLLHVCKHRLQCREMQGSPRGLSDTRTVPVLLEMLATSMPAMPFLPRTIKRQAWPQFKTKLLLFPSLFSIPFCINPISPQSAVLLTTLFFSLLSSFFLSLSSLSTSYPVLPVKRRSR